MSLYESLRYSVKDITIFPGDNLFNVFRWAVVVSLISTLVDVFGISKNFLDWRGAWIGTGILLLIYILTLREGSVTDGKDNNDGVSSESEEDIEVSGTGSGREESDD